MPFFNTSQSSLKKQKKSVLVVRTFRSSSKTSTETLIFLFHDFNIKNILWEKKLAKIGPPFFFFDDCNKSYAFYIDSE